MKTILIVFSFQLFFVLLLASTVNTPSVKAGINDWAKMTAKQFNHR